VLESVLLKRFIYSLALLMVSTSLFAAIDLTTVTGWSTVLVGADLDHGNDQQASASIDLLGNATYPMFYMEFDDLGDTVDSNDEVAFSFRADNVVDTQGDFKGYLWIGLDFDNDGAIDAFMVLNGDGTANGQSLTVYDSDSTKSNNSPSTTSLLAGTATPVVTGFSFYHAVAADNPDVDGDDTTPANDTKPTDDYIVSYKINFNALATALNSQTLSTGGTLSTLDSNNGVGINTPFKIVVSSAQQVNSLNGDLGGYDAADSDGATLYTVKGAFTPTITFADTDPLDATQTTITAAPASVAADGSTASTITVQAKDSVGTNLTVSAGTLVLSTSGSATLSSVIDNADGTYTATVTNTVAETVTISGTIAGSVITDTADVSFIPGAASGATTTISSSPVSVAADGISTSTITVQAKDINGNNLISSGGAVLLSVTGSASISSVTDNNNGTYTATVSDPVIETVTISGSIAGNAITATDDVIFTDATKPVISLTGTSPVFVLLGSAYTDAGATALDNLDGDISGDIVTVNPVNTNVPGSYTVTYNVSDAAGNAADEVTRTVTVFADTTKPVITLLGSTPVSLELGSTYNDAGATALDDIDGDITGSIVTVNPVNVNAVGSYVVTYNVTDTAGNAATQVSRTVNVTADVTRPVITLTGGTPVNIELGTAYTDAGATALDNIDGDITGSIVTVNPVNVNAVGSYVVTYNVTDTAGNAAIEVTRTVNVTPDMTKPVINLTGSSTVNVELGNSYIDEGATASDNIDGDITGSIVTVNPVNTSVVGEYTVTYNVADAAGNAAAQVARTVNVTADATRPVITLTGASTVDVEMGSVYSDAGATAVDNIDGDITASLVTVNPVDINTVGNYTVTYNVSDTAGNAADQVTRTVNVVDTTSPGVSILNQPALVNNMGPFTVTIQFTETVNGFIYTDISVANGSAGNFTVIDGDTYTADITPNGAGDVSVGIAANVAQDASFNSNTAAATVITAFDNTPPAVVIDSAPDANQANQSAYPVSGSCTPLDGNVTVVITAPPMLPISNSVSCSAVGAWSTSFDVSGISDGTNIINIGASQTDAAANTGNAVVVQVDKDVLISVPTINALMTNSITPLITGTADAGTTVSVVVAGATYTTTATAGGLWSLDTSSAPDSGTLNLVEGNNEVLVTSVDAAGNSASDTSNNEIMLSLDDDNDGIPNAVECPSGPPYDNSCTDTDGDGTPDFQETDSDADGIPDAVEAGLNGNDPIDSDGDGTPDYQDTDSDNDGIDDAVEGAVDTDGDGIPDYVDVGSSGDSDGDGIPDSVECPAYPSCADTNGDGQPDYLDTDSDGDGINDAAEAGLDPTMPIDTDGDGTPDYRDTDSDDDGVDDVVEGVIDADSDGIPDYVDAVTAGPGAGDSDGDGIADNIECELYPLCADSDGDGIPDYMETDSDDDGIPDAVEAGTANNDADNDGIDDSLDVDQTGGLDLNGDGVDDALPLDTDGDGTPDYQDIDSDGDGLDDAVEGLSDTDNDGIADYLDASNGDASGNDITGSGDSDGDGLSDAIECPTGIPCADIDQDGLPDYMDANATDGPAADFDNDGLLNYLDPDDDNDTIPDVVEDPNFDSDNNPATNPLDSDLDGKPDYLDDDSDGDGISDKDESGASGNDSDGDNIDDSYDIDITGGVDADLDGIDDNVTPLDSDGDTLPDYLDLVFDGDRSNIDTDNDGITDAVECPVFPTDCPDSDGDGTPDYLETDSDGDGLADSDEAGQLTSGILVDTDDDGTPDYQDTDSDNDGVSDAVEGLDVDSDGDGIPDAVDADSSGSPYGGDSDGDGVEDQAECSSYPVCADSDNDGTPDYMDADSMPYDPNATTATALNGVGSNGPWAIVLIAMTFVLRRKAVQKN